MDIQFIASVSVIARDVPASRSLYINGLGLSFEGGDGDYVFTEQLPGTRHFGIWPLRDAATACFGAEEWPADLPIPQASIEFEVAEVAAAAQELEDHGYKLIHRAKTEPWGQTTARLLSPEALLIAICHTPWMHDAERT